MSDTGVVELNGKKVPPAGSNDPADDADDRGQSLEWTCHPSRNKPLLTTVVSIFVLVVALIIYVATNSAALTLLGLVILFASLAKFYFPTRYRLTDKGIEIKTTTQTLHKDWSIYRSCYPDKNGVLLSPFPEPSRLENFRGQFIMFSDNRDEVVAFVREQIKRAHEKGEDKISDNSPSTSADRDRPT